MPVLISVNQSMPAKLDTGATLFKVARIDAWQHACFVRVALLSLQAAPKVENELCKQFT